MTTATPKSRSGIGNRGANQWKQGLPLLRLHGERIYQTQGVFDMISPNIPVEGTYYLTARGIPTIPIVIKATGDGKVVFDGNGNFNLFNTKVADYNYFEA